MARIFHILLLIAALSICPFRCLSQARAAGAETGVAPGCACCVHEYGETPATPLPADDCGCPDCLCRGAIVPDEAGLRDAGQDVPDFTLFPLHLVGELHLDGFHSPGTRVEATSSPPHLMTAGWPVRIAIQSFLL